MTKENDIAIVGMSCHLPGANNIHEFWNNLINGVDSITEAPEERINPNYFSGNSTSEVDRFYFKKGGFVSPIKIDPLQYGILPIAAEGIDPEHLIILYLVKEALNDANIFKKKISLQKCCFILGRGDFVSTAAYRVAEYIYHATYLEIIAKNICPGIQEEELDKIRKEFQSKLGRYQADTAFGVMSNIIASLTANKFDMKGPAYTLDAACASSLIAVEHAINLLLSGQCDIALAGGIHLGQGASFWSVFNIIGAASYKGQIAPFSEDADGLLIGEGAGIVVLKKLDKAVADNDRIYAVIKSCGSSSDGSDVSVMAPSTKGQVETLKITWEKSGMDPNRIGYIETHGTATQVGDRVEIATLTEFFGDNSAPAALLGSVKSNIGHAMPAAGIVGLIKTALALYYRKIPPTLHCEKPLKAMYNSRFMPVRELTDWDEEKYPLIAGVNAFGFGGINSHAILERYSDSNFPAKIEHHNNEEITGIGKSNSSKHGKKFQTLDFSMNFIQDFTALKEVVNKYIRKDNLPSSDISAYFSENINDAVMQEAKNNILENAALQENIIKCFQSSRTGRTVRKRQKSDNITNAGKTIEKIIRFNLENHPYLLDHVIVRQPAIRPLEESNPVVPFTMTLETFCELTQELLPEKKILKIKPAGVYKWIQVIKPFEEKLSGYWKTDDCISWNLPNYAYGDIFLGDTFPVVPDEYVKNTYFGSNVVPVIPDKNRLYSNFLFHGPQYQSIIKIDVLTNTGIHAYIRKSDGKGSLLDSVGQLLGMYCHLALEDKNVTFPMNIEEIIFFQDFFDQNGIFEFTVFIVDIKDNEAVCNAIIKRDGKVWCVVNGWRNRRLNYHRKGLNAILNTQKFILAERLNKNVFFYFFEPDINITFFEFLYERYLNLSEREHYKSLYLNQAKNYLISRVALKDGVRKYLQKEENEELIFPIEISVNYNEQGKPFLYGHEKLKGIEVSIAHKGSEAAVIVSNKPAGIDIEKIEVRSKEFINMAFTVHELDLLKEKENAEEWIARFWVAKEAFGKMLGVGLQGNPKQYEIISINEEELIIENTVIYTRKHRNDYIIGWTQ